MDTGPVLLVNGCLSHLQKLEEERKNCLESFLNILINEKFDD